jgi:hypothetical protein
MGLQRQAGGAVVLGHLLGQGHGRQGDGVLEQGQAGQQRRLAVDLGLALQPLDRPQGVAAAKARGREGVGLGQQLQTALRDPGPGEVGGRAGPGGAGRDEDFDVVLLEALDLAQAQADGLPERAGVGVEELVGGRLLLLTRETGEVARR